MACSESLSIPSLSLVVNANLEFPDPVHCLSLHTQVHEHLEIKVTSILNYVMNNEYL